MVSTVVWPQSKLIFLQSTGNNPYLFWLLSLLGACPSRPYEKEKIILTSIAGTSYHMNWVLLGLFTTLRSGLANS